MIDEQRYRALIQQLATGGITGNKTYHQYHDQFVPRDSESMGYAHGGGVGAMMKANRGVVNEPGGYAGWEENDIFVEDLSPISTPHRNEDGFLISAAAPLENQTGVINARPNIMENAGVTTITNSGINSFNKPNMRQVAGEVNIDPFSNTVAPAPNKAPWEGYVDLIQYPENNPNAGNWLSIANNIDNEPFQEIKGIDFKDAPIEKWRNRQNHPMKGLWDKNVRYKALNDGTAESTAKWLNKKGYELPENLKGIDTRNWLQKTKDGITSVGQRFKEGANMVFSPFSLFANLTNPLNPKSSNYNPNLAGQLNALDQMGNMLYNDPKSGLLKYGSGSVLAGQNAISGFGTNDYLEQLEKKQAYFEKRIAANKKYNKDTYAATLAEIEKEKARQAAITATANATSNNNNQRGGGDGRYGIGSDGQKSYDFGQGFGWSATGSGPVSNRTGRGRTGWADGGIITLKI